MTKTKQRRRRADPRPDDGAGLPRLAFVHIPKTGGVAVTSALRAAYGALTMPGMTTLDYQCYDDDRLRAYSLYKGHAYRRDYRRLPADTIRFTILRDPVRRAASYFTYCRSLSQSCENSEFVNEAIAMAKHHTFIEFIHADCGTIIEHLRHGQLRQFLPEETLAEVGHRLRLTRDLRRRVVREFIDEIDQFEFVMTNEALGLSYPLMASRLALPAACRGLARENVSPLPIDVDWTDVRRALTDVSAAEFECYEHVRERELAWLATELPTPCA